MSAARAMTPVPQSAPTGSPFTGANPARSWGNGRLARTLLARTFVIVAHAATLVAPTLLWGCVVPPPLRNEGDPDAGVNQPPALRAVRTSAGDELTRPGPHELVVGVGELRVTASDTDRDDTLYVRMYVDYGLPSPTAARAECRAAPGATPTTERTLSCSLLGVCTDELADGALHIFELDLYDREPASSPARLFRDVTAPGEVATFWWQITCARAPS